MDYQEKIITHQATHQYNSLSGVELEILHAIKKGMTSAEIAKDRNCSARTVEKHRSNIIKKLGIISSQNALLVWIMEHLELFNT